MPNFVKSLIATVVIIIATISFIVAVQKPPKEQQKVDDPEAIISLDNLHVAPLVNSTQPVPNFASYTNTIEKKKAFFSYLLPEIRRQNSIVEKEREMVLLLRESHSKNQQFSQHELEVFDLLKEKYKLNIVKNVAVEDTLAQLIIRVDVIPEQLILVQAANESGWGTSRFAVKGYNFFGLWCFKPGCGFVPKQRNDEAKHEVAKFRDLSHSVMTYIRNLNRLYAYQGLRQIRLQLRKDKKPVTAKALSNGLLRYSERGQDYIDELQSMLRVNEKYMQVSL
jgi:Bax protein